MYEQVNDIYSTSGIEVVLATRKPRCGWCNEELQTTLEFNEIYTEDKPAVPRRHPGGLKFAELIAEGHDYRVWAYIRCPECNYCWSLPKILSLDALEEAKAFHAITITDEQGYMALAKASSDEDAVREAVEIIAKSTWGETTYEDGWNVALEDVPAPGHGGADAVNDYIRDLHKIAQLAVLEASDQDTHGWNVAHYEQYIAQSTVPFTATDGVDEAFAPGDILDLEALASIPAHKTATRECPACGSTVELEYIPPRAAQRGYWTGRCVCGSRDVLQVTE
jgi:hypothetical protein